MGWIILCGSLAALCGWLIWRTSTHAGWIIVWTLLVYVLYMHSAWFEERKTWESRAVASLQASRHAEVEAARTALATFQQSLQKDWNTFLADRQEEWWRLHPSFRP